MDRDTTLQQQAMAAAGGDAVPQTQSQTQSQALTPYATIARALGAGEVDAEDDARTRPLRACTNFVKAVLLDAAVRGTPGAAVRVLDVACGRGQDIPKLFYALRGAGKTLECLAGLDVCREALEYAAVVGAKFFPPSRVHLWQGSACEPWEKGVAGPTGTAPFDVITCHLALHYWCDTAEHVDTCFHQCAAAAGPAAVLLLSFPDGRWIVRNGRDAAVGTAAAVVTFTAGCVAVEVPRRCLQLMLPPPAPFGLPYTFALGSRRVVASKEFLVHEGEVMRRAARAGFPHVVLSRRLDEAVREYMAGEPYAAMARAMKVAEHTAKVRGDALDLYRFVVLAKTKEAAGRFLQALGHSL
jgi:SAM-dependent methyltransferase